MFDKEIKELIKMFKGLTDMYKGLIEQGNKLVGSVDYLACQVKRIADSMEKK